ncbi:hypothetical protein A2X44_00345 [candidate division CPR3 bacterium GWF2_35_18]|uniref:Glycogen debranching enzyme C-terminal domain-containing protein n=1 Tax=candidate division CPR3 bacterium GW2011_GWF2_35_18 TaxID=1618350 RepID=A0A0G0BL54_UNCC3|nr:MAG: hypothetical protein UR67_C0001G0052 [candidate division CPR3 bacterium GW2011_GWF2_35_18]KKP86710.1 MAG: hypothetical protein UR87_C0012G0002 [candidate division CPR3 bacterium GW2011_GWE2_35_7]OGB63363.1 MAG: hypothetical protein A2X44_00345 [candidate division CPR3 bacterium GWF2_35_18]OGB65569.1 MAG: hypothetical protein A2250_02170 [candidate division CPR3 bacterium RIFOXYA2_FULL_35_13]OGB77062.1 MAG: hypothetical protein A2476_02995 [candidate division CPR3 bacterium RIFOXYC2_FULL
METDRSIINKAYSIAEKSLKSCYNDYGVSAGKHHFVDIWARDSFFALLGTDDYKTLKLNLQTFLSYTNKNGHVPYRILLSSINLMKYLGKPTYLDSPKANYRSLQTGGKIVDGGLLLVISLNYYIQKTKDLKFLNQHWQTIKNIFYFYNKYRKNDLLKQDLLCEWYDAVYKSGYSLYLNVLYLRFLKDFSDLASIQNDLSLKNESFEIKAKLYEDFIIKFWNDDYFDDWIDFKNNHIFNPNYNLLAVIFDVIDKKYQHTIIHYLDKNYKSNDFALETSYPKYPFWRIPFYNYLLGVGDYCNGLKWLQSICFYSVALKNIGKLKESQKILRVVAEKIVEYNDVYEVYERNGKPLKRLFYKSESPFAWSSGLFLFAYKVLYEDFRYLWNN